MVEREESSGSRGGREGRRGGGATMVEREGGEMGAGMVKREEGIGEQGW